jgi:molybdate transport system substrate-binding protein
MRVLRSSIAAFLCVLAASTLAHAQDLTIAAASDLQAALPPLAARFEQETGRKVTLTFGSSGNFFTQIQNGAPFDVFLSADIQFPQQLVRAGLAERASLYEYATGRLVIWTRKDSAIDVRKGLAVLTDSAVHHVAIANPEHAPYGRAAVAALRHEGLHERVRAKFVLGENISQAAQFAQTGNAEVGLLALSLALAPALKDAGVYVEVPASFHPPIEQAAVVLTKSPRKGLATQFVDYLKRPESVRTLQSFGFAVPKTTSR